MRALRGARKELRSRLLAMFARQRSPKVSVRYSSISSFLHKPVIGLVGGIGAGKSSVAQAFETLGAMVIDSDRLAHEELNQPDVLELLRTWWGGKVVREDGSADRAALAKIVFEDSAALSRLESLLYPRIESRRKAIMAAKATDPSVRAFVLDAPKLVEAGLAGVCDKIVFVEAERSRRIARLAESRGWTEEELARREKNQCPLNQKRELADYVIVNNSGIDTLREQVSEVLSSLLASSA